jgi:hypothetical protein
MTTHVQSNLNVKSVQKTAKLKTKSKKCFRCADNRKIRGAAGQQRIGFPALKDLTGQIQLSIKF